MRGTTGRIALMIPLAAVFTLLGYWIGRGTASVEYAREKAAERTARILVASYDIPIGAIITEDMVFPVPYLPDLIVETMTTSLDPVLGRQARYDIARGMPITDGMLGTAPTATPPVETGASG